MKIWSYNLHGTGEGLKLPHSDYAHSEIVYRYYVVVATGCA